MSTNRSENAIHKSFDLLDLVYLVGPCSKALFRKLGLKLV